MLAVTNALSQENDELLKHIYKFMFQGGRMFNHHPLSSHRLQFLWLGPERMLHLKTSKNNTHHKGEFNNSVHRTYWFSTLF